MKNIVLKAGSVKRFLFFILSHFSEAAVEGVLNLERYCNKQVFFLISVCLIT